MASIQVRGQSYNVGKAASAKEIAKIAKKSGIANVENIKKRAEKQGVSIVPPKPGTTPFPGIPDPFGYQGPKVPTPLRGFQEEDKSSPIPSPLPPIDIEMSAEQAADINHRRELANIQLKHDTELQSLKNLGELKVQEVQSAATRFGYEADERAKKYTADRLKESNIAVEQIKGDKNIDLQKIINAGLENVSKTETAGRSDVARITGEFGVEQEKTRQAGQKDIANIQQRGGIYNSLVNAFSF